MGIFKKKTENHPVAQEKKSAKGKIAAFAKVGAPVLKGVHYAAMVAAVLAGIIAIIMVFVSVPPSEMMLPPFLSLEDEEYYTLTVGSGIKIDTPYEDVTTGDIKTVIYAELMLFAAVMIVVAPVSLFLAKFLKNISVGEEYGRKNRKNIKYIGFSVLCGGILIGVARSLFNFMLISNFTAEGNVVHLAVGIDFGLVILGLIIIMFSYFYGADPHIGGETQLPLSIEEEK